MEIKYKWDDSCLLDYENITDICYGFGIQDHKFDTCVLNSKNICFIIENVQVVPQVAGNISPHLDMNTPTQRCSVE